ncbi:MAG: PQQ-binding-like beta-propeller repeat protein, partial [Rubricoccaceae bacterium]|nr:PQQ-binding-like beta-propeller repeat protein [Rubricoccaceae bacterium]
MPRPLLIALLAFAAWPAFAQQPGDILWSTPLEEDPTELMSRPEIGPEGAIHMFVNDIFVIEPDGSVRLRIDANTLYTSDIAVAPDGRIFVAESIFNPGVGVDYYVVGYSPTGEELWRTPFEATEAVSYGPSLGPDGNLYGVVGFGYTTAGAFSVSTDGTFRWSVPGFERESTSWPKEIPFASDRFYAVDESVPCQLFSNGIAAFSFSGEMLWCLPWNVEHPPVVGPDDSVYGLGYNSLTKFSPDGDLLWRYNFPSPVGLLRDPAIGPDGTVYVQESRSLWAFHPDGSVRYEVQIVDSGFPVQPTVSPDGSLLLTQASVEGTQYLIALNAADGSERWRVAIPYITDPPYTFTSDGDVVYVPLRAGGLAPVELMAVYVGDGSAPVTVSAEPVGGPITIPPSGGAFAFAVTLTNTTDQPQGVEAWSAVSGPAGREPVLGPRAVALAP